MHSLKSFSFFIFLLSSPFLSSSQTAVVTGNVSDEDGIAVRGAIITIENAAGGVSTDSNGHYEITVPAGKEFTLVFSSVGFKTEKKKLKLNKDSKSNVNLRLSFSSTILKDVEIKDEQTRKTNLTRIDPKVLSVLPNTSGSFESILKTLPGVTSNNELSSQYNVRGGNYDENLVYVNDIEIYRPFLTRSGQQEGLSFINSDMVSSVLFSAGGFDAKYGDKLSSVLDIQYRKPKKFAGNASLSLLGELALIEGSSKGYLFTYMVGFRRKTSQYILKTLDTKGEYKPAFTDLQAVFSYSPTPELEFNLLSSYANNRYQFVPSNRETEFGTVKEAYRFTVYFDGQEITNFETYMSALSANVKPSNRLTLKFISSVFRSNENETFDVQGQYYLDELEVDFGDPDFGNVIASRGIGTYLTHARNYLNATVFNLEHKGYLDLEKNVLMWGIKYQHEAINDELSEWLMNDSADYSLPYNTNNLLELKEVLKAKNYLNSSRLNGYVQNNFTFGKYSANVGLRGTYWELNEEFLLSPRVNFSLKPAWEKDFIFRLSTGIYHQPPFYRELRDFEGQLNTKLKAQKSYHVVLGSDYNLKIWSRPFKLVSEIYYKQLKDLVTYEIDNVRIRYYANNNAKGYATGLDMKINGEFVKGVESWASLSVMNTREDIIGDFYYDYYNAAGEKIIKGYNHDQVAVDSIRYEPGYVPRPTDQRVNFSIFFQDYFKRFPDFKMHLNLIVGSGMPFGPPDFSKYKDTLRFPPYRRVDIGFSYQVKSEDKEMKEKNPFRHFKTIWISLEVFNLLAINNTISYLWIKDIDNRQYAIPNYLTQRQLNLRAIVSF